MPQVEVFSGPGKLTIESRDLLRKLLPIIVADALNVTEKKEMHLTPNDIGVRFRYAGPDDVLTHDVEITVSGNFYPERAEDLKEWRTPQIVRGVMPILQPHISFYVWVKLGEAAFVEAKGSGGVAQE
jgi:hypothetical protein